MSKFAPKSLQRSPSAISSVSSGLSSASSSTLGLTIHTGWSSALGWITGYPSAAQLTSILVQGLIRLTQEPQRKRSHPITDHPIHHHRALPHPRNNLQHLLSAPAPASPKASPQPCTSPALPSSTPFRDSGGSGRGQHGRLGARGHHDGRCGASWAPDAHGGGARRRIFARATLGDDVGGSSTTRCSRSSRYASAWGPDWPANVLGPTDGGASRSSRCLYHSTGRSPCPRRRPCTCVPILLSMVRA